MSEDLDTLVLKAEKFRYNYNWCPYNIIDNNIAYCSLSIDGKRNDCKYLKEFQIKLGKTNFYTCSYDNDTVEYDMGVK